MKFTLVAIGLLVYSSSALATQGCSPNCTAQATNNRIADPEDCRQYYLCLEDETASDTPVPCEDDQYFHEISQGCNNVQPLSCKPCSHCHTRCDAEVDLVSDPMDCHNFYVCLAGDDMSLGSCENYGFFDGTGCSLNDTVCCDPCKIYCPRGGIEVYDPYNCSMYYLCEAEGIPNETHHLKCPEENPIFDQSIHRCGSSFTTCVVPCTHGYDD